MAPHDPRGDGRSATELTAVCIDDADRARARAVLVAVALVTDDGRGLVAAWRKVERMAPPGLRSAARVALVARADVTRSVAAIDEARARIAVRQIRRRLHLAATRRGDEKEERRPHTSMSFQRLLTREKISMPTSEHRPTAVKMYQMVYGW